MIRLLIDWLIVSQWTVYVFDLEVTDPIVFVTWW